MTKKKNQEYSAKNLQSLSDRDAVRQTPGMYIGGLGIDSFHHLADEIWANSVDEYLAGHGDTIIVTIDEDQRCTVQDFGRGIPVDIHKDTGLPGVEMVLTTLHGGGKFRDANSSYEISGGMHGVGSSVVNFLSKSMTITIHKDGFEWVIEFKDGRTFKPLKKGKKVKDTGTTVSFLYDDSIMDKGLKFEHARVSARLKELAHILPGLKIIFRFHGHPEETYYSKEGLVEYIKKEVARIETKARHKDPIFLSGQIDDQIIDRNGKEQDITSYVDLALMWTDDEKIDPSQHSFVNAISTYRGGTHVKGVESGLRKVLNETGQELGKFRAKDEPFTREDVREGLVWAILHKLPNPHFDSQIKHTLSSPEVEKRLDSFVCQKFSEFLLDKKNKTQTDAIFDRVIEARDARIATSKSRKMIQRKSGLLGGGTLPGKLKDATSKDSSITELYLVEGDSAGSNLDSSRNRQTQGILPLRGKIKNAEKESDVLNSDTIKEILAAIGGQTETIKIPKKKGAKIVYESKIVVDVSEPRYGKIILATDADVDGGHIQALLMTFFFRYTPSLLRDGRIYIARPPLYRVEHKKEGFIYLTSEEELLELQKNNMLRKNADGSDMITRFKGLGEMNAKQTKDTLVNPETRWISRVVIDDYNAADQTTRICMGSSVEPRRALIEEQSLTEIADI